MGATAQKRDEPVELGPGESSTPAYCREELRRLEAAIAREDGPYSGLHDMAGTLNNEARRRLDAFFKRPDATSWQGVRILRVIGTRTVGELAEQAGLLEQADARGAYPDAAGLRDAFSAAVAERRAALELLARHAPEPSRPQRNVKAAPDPRPDLVGGF